LLNNESRIIRSTVDRNLLDKVLDSLQLNQAAAVVDWKMKLLMMLYRESMLEYFGKRGIPWLGIMLIRKRSYEENQKEISERKLRNLAVDQEHGYFAREFETMFYDGITDDCKEDAWAVASHLQRAVKHFRTNYAPEIDELLLLSDGARCLSGVDLLLIMPHFYKWTGVKIIASFI
jgi:hypothetical protein